MTPPKPLSRTAKALLILSLAALLLTLLTHIPRPSPAPAAATPGWTHTSVSSASQGKLWSPVVWRTYAGPRLPARIPRRIPAPAPPAPACPRWAVVTTIFAPSALLAQLRALPAWCLVVVADRRTPHPVWARFAAAANASVYLSPRAQAALPYSAPPLLPWDHFGRKNIGYLYALHHGARYIWDTDDDNTLIAPHHLSLLADFADDPANAVPRAAGPHHLFNPYPAFRPLRPRTARPEHVCWPRGFPLEYAKDPSCAHPAHAPSLSVARVAVFQSLANNDPDVDAVYRLTKELPLSFASHNSTLRAIALQPGRVAPFNAQATLWTRPAFWGLLLPVSVHGRVTDIWRAYVAQCLRDFDLHVAFTSPIVVQYRNVHSLTADLQSEVPLYTQADQLTKWLRDWKPKNATAQLPERIEQLFIDLYEIGVLEESDVKLVQAWLNDLLAVGYEFPSLAATASTATTDDPPKEPDVESKPKTAVCVSGQLRSLDLELNDSLHPGNFFQQETILPNPNMTVAQSIQTNLFPKLGEVDVFMTVATRETKREPRVGDLSVCESLRPPNGILKCDVPKEQSIQVERRDTVWESFELARYASGERVIQGLLQQLKGILDCYAMIRKHSLSTGKEYDWIVRMRTDNYMYAFPDLERLALNASKPTVWFANLRDCCCGNEDRFGIAPTRWMEEYFTRFLYLQQVDWRFINSNKWRKCPTWNAEAFLESHLFAYGIALEEHPEISICPLKPADRHVRSQP